MIIGVIVASSVIAQASSFSWKTSATGKVYEAVSSTLLASGTTYLLDSATVAKPTFTVFEDGDNIFISDLVNGAAQATSTTTLSFNLKNSTQATAFTADTLPSPLVVGTPPPPPFLSRRAGFCSSLVWLGLPLSANAPNGD